MLEIMVDDAVWTDVEEGTEALLQESIHLVPSTTNPYLRLLIRKDLSSKVLPQ